MTPFEIAMICIGSAITVFLIVIAVLIAALVDEIRSRKCR